MDTQAAAPAMAGQAINTISTSTSHYLETPSPGSYTLMPGTPSSLPDAQHLGSFAGSYSDMLELFGEPDYTSQDPASKIQVKWTLAFMDEINCDIVVADIANCIGAKASYDETGLWCVSGQDARALAAVANFIKENYQELCH